MDGRFPNEVESILISSGWYVGRKIPVGNWPCDFQSCNAVRLILLEFGGLAIESSGPGIDCARSSVEFDVSQTEGERGSFDIFSKEVGFDVYPLGEVDHGRFFLGCDRSGQVYIVGDVNMRVGESIDIALTNLLLGKLGEPL